MTLNAGDKDRCSVPFQSFGIGMQAMINCFGSTFDTLQKTMGAGSFVTTGAADQGPFLTEEDMEKMAAQTAKLEEVRTKLHEAQTSASPSLETMV